MAREEQDKEAGKLMSGVGLAERTVKCVLEDSVIVTDVLCYRLAPPYFSLKLIVILSLAGRP